MNPHGFSPCWPFCKAPKAPWMRIAVPSFSWTTCARRSGVWVHWTWTLGAAMPIWIRRSGMGEDRPAGYWMVIFGSVISFHMRGFEWDWHVGTLALPIWDIILIYIYIYAKHCQTGWCVMCFTSHVISFTWRMKPCETKIAGFSTERVESTTQEVHEFLSWPPARHISGCLQFLFQRSCSKL